MLTDDEIRLIEIYRRLTPENKAKLIEAAISVRFPNDQHIQEANFCRGQCCCDTN